MNDPGNTGVPASVAVILPPLPVGLPTAASPALNMALWHALAGAPQEWLSFEELSQRLGIPMHAVGSDLAALDAFGFGVEMHPYHGARSLYPCQRLCPDQIQWQLPTCVVGRQLSVWQRVSSTQAVAARAAGKAQNEGLVVFAEEQTAGRGRRGRVWQAPPGTGLLMSVLLFPPPQCRDPQSLTALGAVAVGRLVEETCGRPVRIKRPNDVQVAGRKISGVLVEQCGAGFVVGIGLNVNVPPGGFPNELRASACSLAQWCCRTLDRSDLARRLLEHLDALYLDLCGGGTQLRAWWQQRCTGPGGGC